MQQSFTISSPIKENKRDRLQKVLEQMKRRVIQRTSLFGDINNTRPHIHFARWMILDLDGDPLPERLVYNCFFDDSLDKHLEDLCADKFSNDLNEIYQFCEGYDGTSKQSRITFMKDNNENDGLKLEAFYTNELGRTLIQIGKEQDLRDFLQKLLNNRSWAGKSAIAVWSELMQRIKDNHDNSWALESDQSLFGRIITFVNDQFRDTTTNLIGTTFSTLSEFKEFLDEEVIEREAEVGKTTTPRTPKQKEFQEELDYYGAVQSPFSAIGLVKSGFVARITLPIKLGLANSLARTTFSHGSLAGIRTIHSACWISLDNRKRILFFSNYDGSLENYNSDFVDLSPWGLNLVFGDGVDYPAMNTVLSGGAENEFEFRNFLRKRQVNARIWTWYSAYPDLSASNLRTNSEIRKGVKVPSNGFLSNNMTEKNAQAWLDKI